MKKTLLLIIAITLGLFSSAQTQRGYVKTKGRMIDGKHVPGQGIKGASITVLGSNSFLVNTDDGSFSFPVPSKNYQLKEVKKNGYQLVDADIIRRSYTYSATPLYIVMETPEQQLQDQLESERKIRRTLQQKLQQREDELEAQQEAHKITLDEYQQAMQKLYADQENNERLISDMAKQYAQMDYDQMDDLNQRISDAILNGRLTEADSLLRSKGDMASRVAEIRMEQQAEAQREEDLAQAQQDLSDAKAGTQKKLEDVAADCEKYFDLCKLNMAWDSAAYYVTLRAELDTTNADWQFDAAYYSAEQNNYKRAEKYYLRYLGIKRTQNSEYGLSSGLNNLAILYRNTQRYTESEAMYLEALEIQRRLSQENPQACEPDVAMTLNNLAALYYSTQRLTESESMHLEALEIRRRLAQANPQAYEPDLANSLNNLAALYYSTQRHTESEAMYLEALEIRRRLAQANPQAYEPDVASTLNNLAILYKASQRFTESEDAYLKALEIRRRLAQANPQAYEPDVATTLSNLASLYSDTQRYTESESMNLEALEIRRRLAQANPQAYEPDVANTLNNLANLYSDTQHYAESESMHLEALEIRRRLAQANPQAYEPDVASTLNNLALLYQDTQRIDESETIYLEALEIYRRLAEDNPLAYEPDVAMTLNNLATLYKDTKRLTESETAYIEALAIRRRLTEGAPQTYKSDMAQTLFNYGLLLIEEERYSEAISAFEEAMPIYQILAQNNSAFESIYTVSLYFLAQLYPMTGEHAKHYAVNEKWLPFMKEWYQEDKENHEEDYIDVLGSQSFQCIFMKRFTQAEQYSKEALTIDPSQHWIYTNLAAALLLQGKYDEAEAIYRQYKDELKESFLGDFNDFEAAGIIPEERKADVERIRKMLNE